MRRQRGLTLLELMGTLTLLGAVTLVAAALSFDAQRTHDLGAAYANDIAETRRALEAVERDVRCAHEVRVDGKAVVVATDAGDVVWTLDGKALRRGSEVMARNIARFDTHRAARGVVDVRIELGRRSPDARASASVETTVAMRAPAESAK